MEKAINQLRMEMGPEAIILSSQNLKTGEVQLTAAVEQLEAPVPSNANSWASEWDKDWKVEATPTVPQKPGIEVKESELISQWRSLPRWIHISITHPGSQGGKRR